MRTAEYIEARSIPEPNSGCWLWTAGTARGYGLASWQQGKYQARTSAHRIAYEVFVGPIPDGLTIDHLCRTPRCVNPAHLEAVTMAENSRRGDCVSAVNRRKTMCIHGHPFDQTYLRKDNGLTRRRCSICIAVNCNRYRARKRLG